MKIIIVNKLYHPWIGGIETITQDIAEGLHGRGFDTEVLACVPKGVAKEEVINDVPVHKAASFGILMSMPISFDFLFKFKKLARNSDIIFLQHPFPLGTLAYLLFGGGKPLVVWYHSDIERQRIANIFFTPILLASLRRASKIFVASNSLAKNSKYLKEFDEKISVVPFSVEPENFLATPDTIKTAKNIREKFGHPLILSVGRLVSYKGYEYLIRSMKSVDANLIIIGRGPLLDTLRSLAQQQGVYKKIHFLDYASDLIPYYYASDLFVLPSIYKTEAFGIVQIEAMACGKPIVNTSLPTGVPEVSKDGETGYTVPIKDSDALGIAINKILNNPSLKDKLGKTAHERVLSSFSRKKFLDSLSDTFKAYII